MIGDSDEPVPWKKMRTMTKWAGCKAALLALTLSGCALQIGVSGPPDTAKYQTMSCADLEVAMGTASKSVSQTAIVRGRATKLRSPRWVPGGSRVISAVTGRQTARIERLTEEEAAIDRARRSRCQASRVQ